MKERGKGLRRTGVRRAAAAAPGPGRGGRVLAKGMRPSEPAAAGPSRSENVHSFSDDPYGEKSLLATRPGPGRPPASQRVITKESPPPDVYVLIVQDRSNFCDDPGACIVSSVTTV